MPTLCSSSAELRDEVATLKEQVHFAEEAAQLLHQSPADVQAQRLREQLVAKQRELAQAEQAEAESAESDRHAQQLQTLREIEADESHAKAEVLSLQRESATLPGRLQLAQRRHSELLRRKTLIKRGLGIS